MLRIIRVVTLETERGFFGKDPKGGIPVVNSDQFSLSVRMTRSEFELPLGFDQGMNICLIPKGEAAMVQKKSKVKKAVKSKNKKQTRCCCC